MRLVLASGQVAGTTAPVALPVLEQPCDNDSVELDLPISRTHLDQLCGRHPTLTVVGQNG